MMREVSEEVFIQSGIKPVCGFVFRYDPADPGYGVGVVTDGTIPQLVHLRAALDVGQQLQATLFGGQAPRPPARIFW